jgi:hypothetical protein
MDQEGSVWPRGTGMEWNPYNRATPPNPYQLLCHHASVYHHGTVGLYALTPPDDVMSGYLDAAPRAGGSTEVLRIQIVDPSSACPRAAER